ncbi:MAG TPA: glycoside hydrolase family 2 TIM barrel-domain containing protein, partial [bacterium]|nr:glycoside hydrolase family 2 TIM barrel-domain containing protein [bacterium]
FATKGVHIEDVFVSPKLLEEKARVEIHLSRNLETSATLKCRVTSPSEHEVAYHEVNLDKCETDSERWHVGEPLVFSVPIKSPQPWSPESPALYKLRVTVSDNKERTLAEREVRFGMRDVSIEGSRLLLNGKPLYVRGVLHWGYYPDLFTMDPSEEQIRREFEDFRAAGFNVVKVCLFLFPKRFYEIADETGMLIWQEYPIWQTFPQQAQPVDFERFSREFAEWFRFDRNHPSVILRDLACEAHQPDPDLMKAIYEMGKRMTDGAPLEDNSAYLNQVYTDWYDCHMYRELDQLYDYLPSLAEHLRNQNPIRPYMSGEDLDEDTYRDCQSIRAAFANGSQMPWWLTNNNFRQQESFEKGLSENALGDVPKELVRRQNLHAIAFRKACFEEFRRFPELNGYVMTSVRDTPPTRPGFYDDLMQTKWAGSTWLPFNSNRVLILHSLRRSRCFRMDETIRIDLVLSNFGDRVVDEPYHWQLLVGSSVVQEGTGNASAEPGTVTAIDSPTLDLPEVLANT